MKIKKIKIGSYQRKTECCIVEMDHIPNARIDNVLTSDKHPIYFKVIEITDETDTLVQFGYYHQMCNSSLEQIHEVLDDLDLRLATKEETTKALHEARFI